MATPVRKVTFTSCNVRGINGKEKRASVFMWLKGLNSDIYFLQETHCHLVQQKMKWTKEWGGTALWSLGTNNSKGVAILFKPGMKSDDVSIENVSYDAQGRFLKCTVTLNKCPYNIVNIYCPNNAQERKTFIQNLDNLLEIDKENIVGGDFNCVFDNSKDRFNCKSESDHGTLDLLELMRNHDLEDVFRRRFPLKKSFTWRGNNKASRIDFWLISKSTDYKVKDLFTKVCPFSDHNAICMSLSLTDIEHGKGLWKMNASILKHSLFVDKFLAMWQMWKYEKQNYNDLRNWWDITKKRIKDLMIKVSMQIRKDEKMKETSLSEIIEKLQGQIDEGEDVGDEIMKKKKELGEIYRKRANGAYVRSRAQWLEEGETSSRYFHNLEKVRSKDKLWDAIFDESGQEVTGVRNIMDVQRRFYENLYKSEISDRYCERQSFTIETKLCSENKLLLERKFDKEELRKAVFSMKDNKTPGPDGIGIEFYKLYFDELSEDLLKLYDDIFVGGSLCYSQYQVVLRLLYKKGDRKNIKNWRPISLQNVDLKIISKMLAERLKLVMSDIIHVDQQGCIPGRYIGKNIRLIQDVINEKDDDSLILLLDQEKAFDRVEWSWLLHVLSSFGFGPNFIKWISIMYKNPKSAILTNGFLSEYFELFRGIRQGDALSALLYIIQAEPMAVAIRNDSSIEGITLNNNKTSVQVKISQFVDDTTIFLKHPGILDKVIDILNDFGTISGSKLNIDKCKVLTVSNQLPVISGIHNIQITKGPETVLGINVGKFNENKHPQWRDKIKKIENLLAIWKMRDLSIKGRVYILKSVGISSLLYQMEMQEVGDDILKEVSKIMFNFLWQNGRPLVKKDICYLPIENSGLNMVNISVIVKVKRIQFVLRVLNGELSEPWKIIPLKYFQYFDHRFDIDYFALKATDSSLLIKKAIIPDFYKDCILSFQEFLRSSNLFDKMDEILWCNTNILFNNDPLVFPHWSKAGLKSVHQVLKKEGGLDVAKIDSVIINNPCKIFETAKLKIGIPGDWKQNELLAKVHDLSLENLLDISVQIDEYGKRKKLGALTCKDIYYVLKNKNVQVNSYDYWKEKFPEFRIEWTKFFVFNVKNKLISNRISEFNWKIFHGKLNTEKRLQRMKLSDGRCVICGEIENVDHLFLCCIGLNVFWENVENLVSNIIENVVLTNEVILLGYLDEKIDKDKLMTTNFLISLGKYILWKRRNYIKYEKRQIGIHKCFEWYKFELRGFLRIFSNCKLKYVNQFLDCLSL